jgi:hypothetical protein
MADDRDNTSEDVAAASVRSAANLEDFDGFFARRSSVLPEDPSCRTIRKAVSVEQLESLASAARTFEQSQSGSTAFRTESFDSWWNVSFASAASSNKHLQSGCTVFRTESSDSWWTVRNLSAARQMRRHVEVAGSAGPSHWEHSAGTFLPEWPAVNDADVASGKQHFLTFDLDPTTLPSDVLCHLAMDMFVSAGLPAGLAEDRVRRFILAVRASMLDNPYHNFYHVFDVMQTTNAFWTSTGTMARLDSWERFALLSAALW